ncbi:unnamed protein product [Kuraishia capsulata CBS 1993]|uniref:Uncharacterized protein n=1 Tax=Kuraishia capsulata CBS 1993 TaxID=1382522 RepID=W6MP86_9ASCO|nr:uncharacterized protein KUCA_T00002882001 [Kuraishia capsulata CBS 1993]CDK26907.1 unnamed protein product [Kuraishia capsulata CBS 1993]
MVGIEIDSFEQLRQVDLFGALTKTFADAESSNNLVFVKSNSELIRDEQTGMMCELKIVQGLASRPINRPSDPTSSADGAQREKKEESKEEKEEKLAQVQSKNPFLLPEPELTVSDDLLKDYRLILNKYPNSLDHFLMVTRKFVPQDTLLSPLELQLMYGILKNLNDAKNGARFFGFFNSGPQSGYSQYHKHMQFMRIPDNFPVFPDSVVNGVEAFLPGDLAHQKQPMKNNDLSFQHLILPLPSKFDDDEACEDWLSMAYMALVRRAMNIFKDSDLEFEKISYNFLITDRWMMLVPRRFAHHGVIWINSLGFLGLFSTKNEETKQVILDLGFSTILKEVGFPNDGQEHQPGPNEAY